MQVEWFHYREEKKKKNVQLFMSMLACCLLLTCVRHFKMYLLCLPRVTSAKEKRDKSVVVPPSCGGSCKSVPVVVAALCQ